MDSRPSPGLRTLYMRGPTKRPSGPTAGKRTWSSWLGNATIRIVHAAGCERPSLAGSASVAPRAVLFTWAPVFGFRSEQSGADARPGHTNLTTMLGDSIPVTMPAIRRAIPGFDLNPGVLDVAISGDRTTPGSNCRIRANPVWRLARAPPCVRTHEPQKRTTPLNHA